ncbi:MAG TPA: hypothetical protein DEH02_07010 [Bacteroidales bacterium]|nr:MAG: hypothetical protein A2X01_15855 [Bacteroidetes bacterium GWF2_35_48]HBX50802.1 hypothetical protein [Bacteroidales bacterium]
MLKKIQINTELESKCLLNLTFEIETPQNIRLEFFDNKQSQNIMFRSYHFDKGVSNIYVDISSIDLNTSIVDIADEAGFKKRIPLKILINKN